MTDFNPYAASATDAFVASYRDEGVNVDSLSVSKRWKRRFHLIKAAGGIERAGLGATGFNVLGFLLGPIYYLFKGMWKKALGLVAIAFGIDIVLSIAVSVISMPLGLIKAISMLFSLCIGIAFALRANIDYYKKKVLNDKSWW